MALALTQHGGDSLQVLNGEGVVIVLRYLFALACVNDRNLDAAAKQMPKTVLTLCKTVYAHCLRRCHLHRTLVGQLDVKEIADLGIVSLTLMMDRNYLGTGLVSTAGNKTGTDLTTAAAHKALVEIKQALAKDAALEVDQALLKAAETMADRPARQFLLDCVPLVTQSADGMAVLKRRFDQSLKNPRMKVYKDLSEQLSNLIAVCRKALEGKPHLEFLFNGLCASRALTDIIACSTDPQFRKLFQDISFDPTTAARDLEAQLAAVMHQ